MINKESFKERHLEEFLLRDTAHRIVGDLLPILYDKIYEYESRYNKKPKCMILSESDHAALSIYFFNSLSSLEELKLADVPLVKVEEAILSIKPIVYNDKSGERELTQVRSSELTKE